jgi:hypothetical protein
LAAFTWPGAKFIVDSKALRLPAGLRSTWATTVKLDWDVISEKAATF